MIVQFLKGRKYKGEHFQGGDVTEVDDDTARELILAGAAVEIKVAPKKAKADAKQVAKASTKDD